MPINLDFLDTLPRESQNDQDARKILIFMAMTLDLYSAGMITTEDVVRQFQSFVKSLHGIS